MMEQHPHSGDEHLAPPSGAPTPAEWVSVDHAARQALARELHGELAQMLVAAKLGLSSASKQVRSDRALQLLGEVANLIDQSLRWLRLLLADLNQSAVRDAGLGGGLRWLAESLQERHSVPVVIPEPSPDVALTPAIVAELIDGMHRLALEAATSSSSGRSVPPVRIEIENRGGEVVVRLRGVSTQVSCGPWVAQRLRWQGVDVRSDEHGWSFGLPVIMPPDVVQPSR